MRFSFYIRPISPSVLCSFRSKPAPSARPLPAILPNTPQTEMKSKFQIYILLIGLLLSSCGQIPHEKFDSEKWQNSNLNLEENWNLRCSMMNDLRNNYKLEGKTKNEIITLLGKPDNETKNEFYYYLGYSGKGINTGTLTVIFNENNVVSKIKVHQG